MKKDTSLKNKNQFQNITDESMLKQHEIFDVYGDYLNTLNQKKLYNFISKNFLNDEKFLSIVNDVIASKNLKDLNIKEREDEFKYFLHNGSRSFILNIIVLKYLSNEFSKNSSRFLDEFWQEKFDRLQNILK